MTDPFNTGADTHFLAKTAEEPDGTPDPDDEQLEETPPDVVAILGFDPLELEDNENT